MTSRAWILNLDADDELAHPDRKRDPFAALEARPELAGALVELVAGGVVLARGARASVGAAGHAFSPTPAARAALIRAGATPGPAPAVEVLRRVADRRFGIGLGAGHTEGAFVLDAIGRLDEVASRIPGPRVFKRIFGFAGRGRHLGRGGTATDAEVAFVARALREDGGVVVEPWLPRTLDLGQHGHVDLAGRLTLGVPTVQTVTRGGTWQTTRRAGHGELTPEEAGALRTEAERVGRALHAAGYFGPFGIDAFRWERNHEVRLVPRCEVNPRYTMGWAIGMGDARPDLAPP